MGQSPTAKMQKITFDLKIKGKELTRASKKEEKKAKENKKKCKKAMEKGNVEGARIYAQNAIRCKNNSLNFLKLSSRMDIIADRVQGAVDMNKLSRSMGQVTGAMESVMSSMGIEDLTKNMDKFEDQFETLDLQAEYMDQAIGNVGVNQMPEGDVEELMSQIADENNIDLEGQLCEADPLRKQVAKAKDENVDEEDDLAKRLANLSGI